jgi:hypothetical protein
MTTGDGFGGAYAGDETDVDTIELELKHEGLRVLTEAAARTVVASADADTTPRPPARKPPNRLSGFRAPAALLTCLSAGAVLFAIGRAPVSGPRESGVASAVARGSIEPHVAAAADPPVRFANPFDPTEVFEFAAGTTNEQARERVATLLTDRARERLAVIRTNRGHRNRPMSPHAVTAQNSARLSLESDALPNRQ